MISSAAKYALRAVAHLAAENHATYVPARSIAEELDLPATFLAKVFKQLVDAGILDAYRGPTGGVRISKPADQVSVRALIEAIDGPGVFTECILGLPGCGEAKPCPMHEGWAHVRAALGEEFERQTIASLAAGYKEGKLRLRA